MTKIAIFPGSFDPFTKGHADIVERGLKMFDKIVIAIGINERKTPILPLEQRLESIKNIYNDTPAIEVVSYTGLTTDFAKEIGAEFILRGVRTIKDYEYERDAADINYQLSGIESVVLFCKPEFSAISSSVVRELHHFGKDIQEFLP